MPIMLCNGQHPVHMKMAESIGASTIKASTGGLKSRLAAAIRSDYKDDLILEGGQPLVQGAAIKQFNRLDGKLILLAADETQIDIFEKLPYYTDVERGAHRLAHEYIDAAICVSDEIASYTKKLIGGPVAVSEPFILTNRIKHIRPPTLESNRIIAVGENRPAMNYDRMIADVEQSNTDVHLDIVGRGTAGIESKSVTGHGFVSNDRLAEMLSSASLFLHTPIAGAFPVSVLEAMSIGLPVLATPSIGNAYLLEDVDRRLITENISSTIDWYFNMANRRQLGQRCWVRSRPYQEQRGVERFAAAFNEIT